ncbi:LCP family protein [Kitasatospora kifunensis]|uniref:LCP family protein required for cell wall assembly n=1 Tax=Kitasatospora kifunensis TaxID=58351 RepID=A0A7W7VW54_KITKI|nr:LCP family protein [Kitasatospora kifunensis]MBB4925137.1 LCP family protein required for cell wall assembly [Kitasatospora kifunensis]
MADHSPSDRGRSARRQAPAAGGPRRSPLVVAGRTIACTLSLAVLGSSGFAWYAYTSLTTGLTTSTALSAVKKSAPPHLDSSVNILLIGLDSRKDMNGNDLPKQFVQDELNAGSSDIGGYNTNTLIVLHIPANGGKVTALSIPRDDYVQTEGADGKMHKIKEAYGIAKAAADAKLANKGLSKAQEEQQSREAGRAATLATVQNFLGIPIDHFAEVNLLGFYDIAQALGPIQVCLNKATSDPAETGQGSGFSGQAGINTLNASQALAFVRQRHNLPGGDLDRTHRQQAFISSAEYKLKQEGVFSDLGKMQNLFNVVKKDVVIDDQWNILDFAQQAPNLTGGNVEFNTLPIAGFATIGGEDVNKVNPVQIKQIVQTLFGHDPAPAPTDSATASPVANSASPVASSAPAPSAPAKASGTVDVFNASTVTGAAGNESKALVAMGFKAGRVGEASSHPKDVTVTYGVGAKDGADAAAARYGVSATASSAVAAGHIEVVLGTGYTPPGAPATAPPAAGAPSASASSTADPAADLPMQGPPVKMGGIPCVN